MRLSPARPGFKSRRGNSFFGFVLFMVHKTCWQHPIVNCKRECKIDPPTRIRTRDLEISVVAIYSLPLYQLSYKRTSRCWGPCGLMDKALPSGGRDCGFESRLGLVFFKFQCLPDFITADSMAQWQRVGSRPEDWGFDSLWGQSFLHTHAQTRKKTLQSRELNPGLPRDRREY